MAIRDARQRLRKAIAPEIRLTLPPTGEDGAYLPSHALGPRVFWPAGMAAFLFHWLAMRAMREMMRPFWWLSQDGDLDCLEMYERHYSANQYRDGRARKLFVGPGEKVVLRTVAADACFVWRLFIDDCIDGRTGERQAGVNCAVFRNESPHKSSSLIRQADSIADCLWPDSRHYTYVDTKKVRSNNPGFCFLMAGWKRCGWTKSGLLILERT